MAAEQTAQFSIDLQGLDEIPGLAEGAAGALDELRDSISADTAALGEMQKAMRALKSGSSTNIAAFKELRDRISAQKDKIAQSQGAFVQLGGSFKRTKPAAEQTAGALSRLGTTAQKMNPEIANLGGKLGALRGLFAGAGGMAMLAAAGFIAFGAAVMVGVAALLKFGIASADARRNEALQLEGLTKVRNFWGVAAGKASDLQGAIDKVSDSSSLARPQILAMAEGLYRSNLRGAALEQALEGVAIATDAAGESQGEFYKSMFLGAGRYGQGTAKVLADVKKRFGEIAARKSLGLEVQARKLKENFARIFDGLKIEGLLKAIKSVTELFSQSTASGRALKLIFEKLLQPLIDGLEFAGPIARKFFQGIIIGTLLAVIGLQRLSNWFNETFGSSELLAGIDAQSIALWAGVGAFAAFGIGVLIVVAALAGLAAMAALAIAPIVGLVAMFQSGYDMILAKDWKGLGLLIARGIVAGITFGASEVVSAIGKLGADAMSALRNKLEVRSPSRASFRLFAQVPKGGVMAIRAGTPELKRELGNMARMPAIDLGDAPSSPAAKADSAGGGKRIEIKELHIHAKSDNPRGLAQDIMRELERISEGVAIELGAPAPEVG